MAYNMTPTKEQKTEFTVNALEMEGFEEMPAPGIFAKQHGKAKILVDLNEKQPSAIFIIDGKRDANDDVDETLVKTNQIIVEAEDGQMPSRTEADIVVNVGTKYTYADNIDAPDQPDDSPIQTHKTMTHEEAMALPKQQFIDRCNAWLDEFNDGKQLKIDDPMKCPVHAWVVYNHQACCKDLVGGIINCPICNLPMCPNCSSHTVTQLSRVTGYIQDIAGWNAGKKQELDDRTKHDTFG